MHRFQIATFGAVAIVFAVNGVNQGIFSGFASLDAMAAGWLILSMVNILWVLYFTSEEDSLLFHVFNSLGTGGLTPPSRRRRATRTTSMMNMGGNGYTAGYASGGIVPYDTKMGGSMTGPIGGTGSFRGGSAEGGAPRSLNGTGSLNNGANGGVGGTGSIGGGNDGSIGPGSPLMGSGAAGIGAGGGPGAAPGTSGATGGEANMAVDSHQYRAKALYNCEWIGFSRVRACAERDTTHSQIPHRPTIRTRFHSLRANSSTSSTRTASGGKQGKPTGRSEVSLHASLDLMAHIN